MLIPTCRTGRGQFICTSVTAQAAGIAGRVLKTIARDLHRSPRTVQRVLNDLERAGYIQRQRRYHGNGNCTSTLYIIKEGK